MKLDTHKVTSSGARIPVHIEVIRVSRKKMLEHQTLDKKERNQWCLNGKPCSKYGTRPCCPPTVKLFSEMRERQYMYLILVEINLLNYYTVYPKVKESKSWVYFGMDGTHKMTRNINNQIVTRLNHAGAQCFRVGGCLGCQFSKTGKCKNFMPPLEGTGVDVVALAEDVFEKKIRWRKENKPMKNMVAVGAIYTDSRIPAIQFERVLKDVCSGK